MDVFLGFVIFAFFVLWLRSYAVFFRIHSFRRDMTRRTLLAILPLLCALLIATVLWKWGSPDVRSSPRWVLLYTMGGAAWLRLGMFLLSLLGVGEREDVVERQNPAAAWMVYGTMIGTTFCYAGSNIGSGPGAEVVLFCAVLSTAFLFGFWFILERIFRLADQITIERNESAGIRVGGWIAGLGLIFGTAVAGDWESVAGTIWDFFRYAWVAMLFLLAAIVIERAFKSLQTRREHHRGASIAVALAYFLAAATYIAWRGIH